MDRERRNCNGNGHQLFSYADDYLSDRRVSISGKENTPHMSSVKLLPLSSSPSSSSSGCSFIEHPVSRFDTLAGVAIKYGVEVADIKKMNGLVTDLQMFALKSLQIPVPGRHPPSPCLSNDYDVPGQSSNDQTPPRHLHRDLFESFQSLRMTPPQQASQAMSSLQGYYGLKPTGQHSRSEGFEMAVYRKGDEDGPFLKPLPTSNHSLSCHMKSKSVANGFLNENGEQADTMPVTEREADSDKWNEKSVRRRQKSEADFSSCTQEMLLKEDNSSSGGFSAIKGKGLAQRPKTVSRTASGADAEGGGLNPIPIGLGESYVIDGFSGVRKSSSTSSLQDQYNSSSSIWPTSKWSLKSDLQALSTAAITKPMFDGLPKPRRKAALD